MKIRFFIVLSLAILSLTFSSCAIVFSTANDYTTNQSRQKKTRQEQRKNSSSFPKEEVVDKPFHKNKDEIRSVTMSKSEMDLRGSIVQSAKKMENIPYLYGGKNKGGFDCSGLTKYVFDEHNISISAASYAQAKQGIPVTLESCRPGDLVFFGQGKVINHVALVVSASKYKLQVIHSTSSKGVITEDVMKSNYWKPKIQFAKDVVSEHVAAVY